MRWRFGLPILLAACSSEVPVTVDDGNVLQSTYQVSEGSYVPVTLVLVVDDADTTEAARLRSMAVEAIRETALAELGHATWSYVDVRGYVALPGGTAFLTPGEDPRLAWREDDASAAGANRFVEAIADALGKGVASPRTSNLEALRGGLALTSDPSVVRISVIASTRDDPMARAEWEPALHQMNDHLFSIVPTTQDCEVDPTTRLSAWAHRNGSPSSSCALSSMNFLHPLSAGRHTFCASRPVERDAAGLARCRVRAFLHDGAPCDPARGYSPTTDSSATGGTTRCEVAQLHGATCIERGLRRDASGWCVPSSLGNCGTNSAVVFVGGASRPSTKYEVTCDHAR